MRPSGNPHSVPLQLASLRTQLVLSTCQCINNMAEVMESNFEMFLEPTVAALLKQSSLTKKIVVNAIAGCMKKVIQCSKSTKPLHQLQSCLGEKNSLLRLKAMEYVLTVMRACSNTALVKHHELMEKCIQKAIVDASSEVRSAAKEIFFYYQERFPDYAER